MDTGLIRSLFCAVPLAGLAIGCDDSVRSCGAVECVAAFTPVRFLDESGAAVGARGQQRVTRGSELGSSRTFDCGPGADAAVVRCSDGTSSILETSLEPGAVYEVRFVRADGSWTDWQQVPLEISERTDADFNGPGCPCSWYEAAPVSIVVPADARLPLGG